MPSHPIDLVEIQRLFDEQMQKKKATSLQEVFLGAVRRAEEPVTMFLVNGVMLQGEIAAFDLFCMLLQREGMSQLVYKHAVSTVQPEHPVSFMEADEEESGG
jgi:host factor-I protein